MLLARTMPALIVDVKNAITRITNASGRVSCVTHLSYQNVSLRRSTSANSLHRSQFVRLLTSRTIMASPTSVVVEGEDPTPLTLSEWKPLPASAKSLRTSNPIRAIVDEILTTSRNDSSTKPFLSLAVRLNAPESFNCCPFSNLFYSWAIQPSTFHPVLQPSEPSTRPSTIHTRPTATHPP